MACEFAFVDSDDESEWTCESVSNILDADGQFSVWAKPTKRGVPGKKSKTGRRVRTTHAVRYLRQKQQQQGPIEVNRPLHPQKQGVWHERVST